MCDRSRGEYIKVTYSQAKTLPAMKQANRSSEASMLTHPVTPNANAIEKTKKDSLSIRFLSITKVYQKRCQWQSDKGGGGRGGVYFLPVLGSLDQLASSSTNQSSQDHTQQDLISPDQIKPFRNSLTH